MDIPLDKSPGPDGFNNGFYREAWPVIGRDMIEAVQRFFRIRSLLAELSAVHLILLPKTDNPSMTAD